MNILVYGAGSIGCYVGGRLQTSGNRVTYVGRERQGAVLSEHGIRLTRFDEPEIRISPADMEWRTDLASRPLVNLVLLCVKSQDTTAAASQLADTINTGIPVISLQNGIGNDRRILNGWPEANAVSAMVGFNVIQKGNGHFHQGTDGEIILDGTKVDPGTVTLFEKAGIATRAVSDMASVQWGKLLMNLNNGLNVLSNRPLKQQLKDRDYRRVLAASMDEALKAMKVGGIKPAKLAKVSPGIVPAILRLNNFLFERIAAGMLKMDDDARSSMWEDLQKGRDSEIDFLNGEIIALAKKAGTAAPVNAAVISEVKRAFEVGFSPEYSGEELRRITGVS